MPLGSEIVASLVPPGGHRVTTPGTSPGSTADAPQPGMGIRFFKLDPDDRRAIDHFVAIRPPMLHE